MTATMSFMIARPRKAKILDLSVCRPSLSRKRLRERERLRARTGRVSARNSKGSAGGSDL
jgi:hypothetical protein